jgi:hypothetical protein
MNRETLRAKFRTHYPHLLPLKIARPVAPLPDPTAIILGIDEQRRPVPLAQLVRGSHLHILGATGGGKSRCILHMVRQLITQNEGVLFVDPHGSHHDSGFKSLVLWLEKRGYLGTRKCHIIDFDATTHTVGFNPLARPDADTDVSVMAGMNLEAMSVSWDDESTAQKPTIERNLTVAFSALAELNLTLLEAPMLFDRSDEHGLRAWAIDHLKDPYIRSELKRLHDLASDGRRARDWDMEIVGPMNRLARLLRPQAIRTMVGQKDSTLDIRQALDEGHIILANLSGGSRVYDKDADLFGRLLTRAFLFHAKRRKNTRPFTMVLDECQRYLSGDLPTLLAEVRKYGVSVVLSHQWLTQLEVHDENLLAAVRNSTAVKICFRIRDAQDAEELARSLIPLDLERPVKALIKPSVIGHVRTLLDNRSQTDQEAETETAAQTKSRSEGSAETRGVTVAETDSVYENESETEALSHGDIAGGGETSSNTTIMVPTDDPNNPMTTSAETSGASTSSNAAASSSKASGRGKGHGTLSSVSVAQSRAKTRSENVMQADTVGKGRTKSLAYSKGQSEALEPVMAPLPTAVHSKDNMLYMAGQALRTLNTGVAYLNYVGRKGMVSTLFTVPPIITEPTTDFDALRDRVLAESSAALPTAKALASIAERQERIIVACTKQSAPEQPVSTPRKRRW